MGKQNHQIEYVHICIYGDRHLVMKVTTEVRVVVPVLSTVVPEVPVPVERSSFVVVSYVTTVAFSESKHPSALIRAISLSRYEKMTHLHTATFRTICSLTVRYFLNSILEWLFHGTHGISFCKRLFLGQFSQQCLISATAEKDILVSFRSSFRVVFCVFLDHTFI